VWKEDLRGARKDKEIPKGLERRESMISIWDALKFLDIEKTELILKEN